jgi:hypothetical protein
LSSFDVYKRMFVVVWGQSGDRRHEPKHDAQHGGGRRTCGHVGLKTPNLRAVGALYTVTHTSAAERGLGS